MQLLLQRLHHHPRQPLPGISAPPPSADALVVAADGPESATRRHWNIPVWRHRYRQGCLTSKVALRGSDDVTAFELFRPRPLAVLPWVTGQRSGVECPMHRCEQRAALPGSAFLDQLAAVLPQGLEPDLLLDTPRSFPQQWQLAQRFSRGRGVLVGEAAHRCHPVGGQGLNLCWRDVEALMSIAEPGLDARRIARRYGRRRWVDVIAVGVATDLWCDCFPTASPRSASCGASPGGDGTDVAPATAQLACQTDGPCSCCDPCQSEGNAGASVVLSSIPTGSFSSVAGFSATKAWLEQKRHQSGLRQSELEQHRCRWCCGVWIAEPGATATGPGLAERSGITNQRFDRTPFGSAERPARPSSSITKA